MSRASSAKPRSIVFPPLILCVLGTGAILAYGYTTPGFLMLEFVILFIAVLFAAIGYTQNTVRGFLSTIILYIATGIAATAYRPLAPYIGSPLGEQVTRNSLVFTYIVLALAVWILLEVISRHLLNDTSIPLIGFLDHVAGAVIYLIIGIFIASLLFNVLGYSSTWGGAHDAATLRPVLRGVFSALYTSQRFWFLGQPPAIYTYDLPG
ncbi:MAG: CvpA family protein [Chloroflexi bacterium]|nr:CvpA family protein [Chloroflexota bacterium]